MKCNDTYLHFRINANVDTISQIELANGDPSNLNHLNVIATDVDADSGEYTWSVPSDIQPGTDCK